MSAVHFSPAIENVTLDHAQREKPCAIAPVTKLRACARAAIADSANGARPGIRRCPSCQRADHHCLALEPVAATPHSSSAAGHNPKRNTIRAASAAAWVPTCAPVELLVAELIAGTQRGSRPSTSCAPCEIV